MEQTEFIFYGIVALATLIMLLYYLRRRHRLRTMLFGVVTGIAALLLLHFYGSEIGYAAPLSPAAIATAGILGAPGVALLILLHL